MRHGNDRIATRRAGTAAAIIAAAGSLLAAGPALAQRDRSLEVDVAECVEIESPAERFRCYESRVDAALDEPRPPAREEAQPAEPSSPPPEPAAEEGPARSPAPSGAAASDNVILEREIAVDRSERSADAEDPGVRRQEERAAEEERPEQEEFFGTIASLRETVPNRLVITLENGQVWRQMRPTFYPLRPGHRVRIYSTNWGDSYRMSSEELRGFIQVERVR